jgi:hypothetical protein
LGTVGYPLAVWVRVYCFLNANAPEAHALLRTSAGFFYELRHLTLTGQLLSTASVGRIERAAGALRTGAPSGSPTESAPAGMLTLFADSVDPVAAELLHEVLPRLCELRTLMCNGRSSHEVLTRANVQAWSRLHRLALVLHHESAVQNVELLTACRQLRSVTLHIKHRVMGCNTAANMARALGGLPELSELCLRLTGMRTETGVLSLLAGGLRPRLPQLRMLHVDLTGARLGSTDHDMQGMRQLLAPCSPGSSCEPAGGAAGRPSRTWSCAVAFRYVKPVNATGHGAVGIRPDKRIAARRLSRRPGGRDAGPAPTEDRCRRERRDGARYSVRYRGTSGPHSGGLRLHCHAVRSPG